jgi:FtsH-binding integral membrane protein
MTVSTLGGIKQAFTYETIVKAFLITATAFGALSLWGYTTKQNLNGIGSFAIMAVWILFAVSIVYMLLPMTGLLQPSAPMEWLISGGFAVLSALLIAFQTQQLKEGYYAFADDGRTLAVMTNWGALNFFVMFVNIFRFVLMLLSSRE